MMHPIQSLVSGNLAGGFCSSRLHKRADQEAGRSEVGKEDAHQYRDGRHQWPGEFDHRADAAARHADQSDPHHPDDTPPEPDEKQAVETCGKEKK